MFIIVCFVCVCGGGSDADETVVDTAAKSELEHDSDEEASTKGERCIDEENFTGVQGDRRPCGRVVVRA